MDKKLFIVEIPSGSPYRADYGLTLTVWMIEGKCWIDVRSLMVGLGMSWVKWSMYLRAWARLPGHEIVIEPRLQDALLVRPYLLNRLLARLSQEPMLAKHATASKRLPVLMHAYTGAWLRAELEEAPATKAVTARKINARLVRVLFALTQRGEPIGGCAKRLRIAEKTARRVKNGGYELDQAARLAWLETFGGMCRPVAA